MATTNHERVDKAVERLKSGLGPFVERELRSTYQDRTAAEALAYNTLVQRRSEITRLASQGETIAPVQQGMVRC